MKKSALQSLLAFGVFAATFVSPALAATDWSANFGGCSQGTIASAGNWSSSLNASCPLEQGGVDVKAGAIAWSSSASPSNASVVSYGTSGLGVISSLDSGATGSHAIDNIGLMDSLVLKFSEDVAMNNVKVGWNATDSGTNTSSGSYYDSDLAVLAWVVFKENVDRRIVLGMAAIVAGALVLSWPGAAEHRQPGAFSAPVAGAMAAVELGRRGGGGIGLAGAGDPPRRGQRADRARRGGRTGGSSRRGCQGRLAVDQRYPDQAAARGDPLAALASSAAALLLLVLGQCPRRQEYLRKLQHTLHLESDRTWAV